MTEKPPKKRLKQDSILRYFETMADNINEKKLGNEITETCIISENNASGSLSSSSIPLNYRNLKNNLCEESNQNNGVSTVFGEDLSAFNKDPGCSILSEKINTTSRHFVLFECDNQEANSQNELNEDNCDKWEKDFVRLPSSSKNFYPVDKGNEKVLVDRWKLISESLLSPISTSSELSEAILKYNSRFKLDWDFSVLTNYLDQKMKRCENDNFYAVLLPKMIKLALDLPKLFKQPIPMLKKQSPKSITFTQKQISCLLANAFFCTFPRRNSQHKNSEYSSYPDINFIPLFTSRSKFEAKKTEKLKCIFNYFKRVTSEDMCGAVTFERKCFTDMPSWENCNDSLSSIRISSHGKIEEFDGMLQVDFANKFIGGGVLRRGCVQEEILFLLCPELIASRLFTEVLENNEALLITGFEKFNHGSGYADTFKWESNFNDTLIRDNWKRRCRQVVAIDAVKFPSSKSPIQYRENSIRRDLNKAYSGFSQPGIPASELTAIVTGNWGCGAFNGDPRFKFIIQLLAASASHRDMIYLCFGDTNLCKDLFEIYSLLSSKSLVIGQVMQYLKEYSLYITSANSDDHRNKVKQSVLNFLRGKVLYHNDSSTEDELNFKESGFKHSKKPKRNLHKQVNGQDIFGEADDEKWLESLYGTQS